MENKTLIKDIKRMCCGKCYRCTECIKDAKNGETEEFFSCRFDDTQKNIIPTFPQVFQIMCKLSKDGNVFYENTVQKFIDAEEYRKKEMEKWLIEELSTFNFDNISLTTALLLLQYDTISWRKMV